MYILSLLYCILFPSQISVMEVHVRRLHMLGYMQYASF